MDYANGGINARLRAANMKATRPRTISKEQWAALKVGDVLVSPAGNERTIVKRDTKTVRLSPLKNNGKKEPIPYWETELCLSLAYRLKGTRRLPTTVRNGGLMEFEVAVKFVVEAKELGEALNKVLTHKVGVGVKDLRCELLKVSNP